MIAWCILDILILVVFPLAAVLGEDKLLELEEKMQGRWCSRD